MLPCFLTKVYFLLSSLLILGASLIAQLVRICLQCWRPWYNSSVGKIPWRRDRLPTPVFLGFPCGSAGKESACNVGDLGWIPGLGRSPAEDKDYPLRYPGLENSMALLYSPWGHKELGMTEQLSFNLSCWYSPPNNGGHGDILRFCSTCAFFSQIMSIVLIGRYWSLFSSIGILLIESESALNCVTGCQYSILPVLCTVSTKISKTRFLLSISLRALGM